MHAVVRGRAWLWTDHGGDPLELIPGDLALVRGGPDHYIAHKPGARCILPGEFSSLPAGDAALSAPGSTVFLCGAYRFAGDIGRGLVAALPPVLSLPASMDTPMHQVVTLLSREMLLAEPGKQTVLDRLLDVLVVLGLRAGLTRSETAPPWFRAARGSALCRRRLQPGRQRYLPHVYTQRMLAGMSVPMALLGLLDRQPSHGYDLKRDYDAYFSRGRPLPFGQVYATLARLARDGRAIAGEAEPGAGPDRKRYTITETGKSEVETWLAEPIPADPYLQTDLFVKVVLSLMLGRPAEEYLDVQRAAHLQRMRELTDLKQRGSLVDALLADHGLFHLDADLRWIDLTAARLAPLAEEVAS